MQSTLNPLLSSFIMLLPEPVGPRFLNGLLTIKLVLRKIHTHFEKLTYLGIHSLYQYETLSVCLQDFEDYILVLTPQLCINFEPQHLFPYGNPKSILCDRVEGHIVCTCKMFVCHVLKVSVFFFACIIHKPLPAP
jgi:hypothetical protein